MRPVLLLFFFCLFSGIAYGQKKQKGYVSISLGLDLPKAADPPVGGYISGNLEIIPGIFLGGQVGVIAFPGKPGVVIPLQGKFTALTAKNFKKVSPLIVLEPGFGVYNKKIETVTTQGGFIFYGGAGASFPGKGKCSAFITVGYSRFTFTVDNIKEYYESVGIRAGIMIR